MMDHKQLAAEREERLRSRGIDPAAPASSAGVKVAANPWGNQRQRHSASTSSTRSSTIFDAHRSIRMAHSLGFLVCLFSSALVLFPWVTRTKILLACIFVGGAYLARSGGSWLHGMLPAVLQEGSAPTEHEIGSHDKSLFTPRLSSEAFNEEWHVALDSLAWCCTYGKKNCITSAIYSANEPLSLGKIMRITWAKVSEGTFRCN